VLLPVQNPKEMGLTLEEMERRFREVESYRRAFRTAFSRRPGDRQDSLGLSDAEVGEPLITSANAARALASYLRTLMAADASRDRFGAGDTAALSPLARQGFTLFNGRAGCADCHAGPTLSDGEFHNTGVSWGEGDPGRFRVTGDSADLGAFQTPTLRDVARTAPYMHDGSLLTLEDVVDFYDRGGRSNSYQDPAIRPLELTTRERRTLRAFLRALSSRQTPVSALNYPCGGPESRRCRVSRPPLRHVPALGESRPPRVGGLPGGAHLVPDREAS
jgi:cytochrome c peroxidase